MSGNVLRPPLRNKSARPSKRVSAVRSVKRIGRQSLIERRDLCMTEIERLSGDAIAVGSFPHKARQLLTRHWWPSSWRARADLLRTAEWLVGIGKSAKPPPTVAAAPPRRPDGSRPS